MNCDNDHQHLDGLPALDLDHALRTGERAGKRRGRSPTRPEVTSPHPNHSSEELDPQRSGRVPLPPVATTAEPSAATCHTCGFSAEHLLRMSDTVQALIGSGAELSGSKRGLDILRLFLRFISDYATKRLPHNATSTKNSNSSNVMN